MADIFEAPKKPGHGVGVQVVVLDESGQRISNSDQEMWGFDRVSSNAAASALVDGIKAMIGQFEAAKAEKEGKRRN